MGQETSKSELQEHSFVLSSDSRLLQLPNELLLRIARAARNQDLRHREEIKKFDTPVWQLSTVKQVHPWHLVTSHETPLLESFGALYATCRKLRSVCLSIRFETLRFSRATGEVYQQYVLKNYMRLVRHFVADFDYSTPKGPQYGYNAQLHWALLPAPPDPVKDFFEASLPLLVNVERVSFPADYSIHRFYEATAPKGANWKSLDPAKKRVARKAMDWLGKTVANVHLTLQWYDRNDGADRPITRMAKLFPRTRTLTLALPEDDDDEANWMDLSGMAPLLLTSLVMIQARPQSHWSDAHLSTWKPSQWKSIQTLSSLSIEIRTVNASSFQFISAFAETLRRLSITCTSVEKDVFDNSGATSWSALADFELKGCPAFDAGKLVFAFAKSPGLASLTLRVKLPAASLPADFVQSLQTTVGFDHVQATLHLHSLTRPFYPIELSMIFADLETKFGLITTSHEHDPSWNRLYKSGCRDLEEDEREEVFGLDTMELREEMKDSLQHAARQMEQLAKLGDEHGMRELAKWMAPLRAKMVLDLHS